MINQLIRDCDTDLADARPPSRPCWPASGAALARRDHLPAGRPPAGSGPRGAARGGGVPAGPGARHHRHRRVGQVVADRRAGPPAPHRPAGQAARGGAGRRPDPPARRRRAARRPDPDERPRRRARVLPLAGHPRRPRNAGRLSEAIVGACQAAGYDLVILETPGIGQGDAAVVPLRRRLAVRDDARVRRGLAAGKDRHAGLRRRGRDQQVRAARRAQDALRDVSRQLIRNREAFGTRPEDMPVFGTSAATLQRRRRHRALPAPAGLLAEQGLHAVRRACCRRSAVRTSTGAARDRPAGARSATWPRSPTTVRGYHAETDRQVEAARRRQQLTETARRMLADGEGMPMPDAAADGAGRAALTPQACTTPSDSSCSRGWPARCRPRMRATSRWCRSATGRSAPPLTRETLSGQPDAAGGAAAVHRPRGAAAVPAAGEPAGLLPVHRRRVPVQARGRGPGADVRRGGRPVPHQPPVQAARRRAAGHPAVHRVRLGHPVRRATRRAPRHLRQGRHLGRLDRHAGRHEGAVRRVRPVSRRPPRCR